MISVLLSARLVNHDIWQVICNEVLGKVRVDIEKKNMLFVLTIIFFSALKTYHGVMLFAAKWANQPLRTVKTPLGEPSYVNLKIALIQGEQRTKSQVNLSNCEST